MTHTKRSHFTIEPATSRMGLLHLDPSTQIAGTACSAYLHIDTRDGKLWLDTYMQSENAVPMDVWHGLVVRVPLEPNVDAIALTEDINRGVLDALIGRIVDGTEKIWNGNNYVARRTDDAKNALYELQQELISYADFDIGLVDAYDWLYNVNLGKEYGITADTSEEELKALVERIEAEALEENAVLYNTLETLIGYRDNLDTDTDA